MAYEIHIARRAPEGQILPIALSEWRAVVQQTHNVRMAEGDFEITNPKTGEIIRLRNAGGDAEAFFPQRPSGCVCFAGHLPAESRSGNPVILICPLPGSGALLRNLLTPWEHHLSETRVRSTTEQRSRVDRAIDQEVRLPGLARMRSADCIEECPSSRAKRKTYVRIEFFSV